MKRNVKRIIKKRLYHVPPAYNMSCDTMLEIRDMATTDGIVDISSLAYYVFTYGYELGYRAGKRKAASKMKV